MSGVVVEEREGEDPETFVVFELQCQAWRTDHCFKFE
jgi:hypothetical protein